MEFQPYPRMKVAWQQKNKRVANLKTDYKLEFLENEGKIASVQYA